jgi:hypothetical protein
MGKIVHGASSAHVHIRQPIDAVVEEVKSVATLVEDAVKVLPEVVEVLTKETKPKSKKVVEPAVETKPVKINWENVDVKPDNK